MACMMRKWLLTYCHRRLIHRTFPLWKCRYSSDEYKKHYADTEGSKYRKTKSSVFNQAQHEWLGRLKTDIIDRDEKFDFSESQISELEAQFRAESNGNLMHFDLVLMTLFRVERKAKEGFLFMKYIRKKRQSHMLVLIEYMLCCYVEYPKLILEEYKTLKESLDLSTVNIGTLHALAKVAGRTSLWRDAYEMLDILQKEVDLGENQEVLNTTSAAVLCSGIAASNYELLLEMAYKHPKWFNCGVQRGIITPALFDAWQKGHMHMDLFFQMLKDMGQFLNLREGQAREIKMHCQSKLADKVECELTNIEKQSGICNQCSQKLTFRALEEEEFKLLKEAVFSKLVYGRNIFECTTPQAIAHFLKFLENSSYDVVMDGPNVYYGRDEVFWENLSKMVKSLSSTLNKKGLKILLITDAFRFKKFYVVPRHLKKYVDLYVVDFSSLGCGKHLGCSKCVKSEGLHANFEQSKWKKRGDLYKDRLSSDDVFMLVAAFKSGPNTFIVTNDNLRNHRVRLGDPCDKLFNIWQKRNQILHDYTDLEFPVAHDSTTHVTEEGWHVPYEDDIKVAKKHIAYFKDTDKFLCVKKLRPFKSAQLQAYLRMKEQLEKDYKSNSVKD